MDTRVITEDLIFPIVKILFEDPELVIGRQRLSLALGLTQGEIVDIERMPTHSYDTPLYLTAVLNKWVSKLDCAQPTIASLAGVLRVEHFIATSGNAVFYNILRRIASRRPNSASILCLIDKVIQFGRHIAHNSTKVKSDIAGQKCAEVPLCFNVPEDNCSTFIGRSEDIQRLHESITGQNFQTGTGTTPKRITVLTTLSGISGMGKSAIASHYALKYFKSEFYYNVIWINSESTNTISKSFRRLAENVGISISLETTQIAQKFYKSCDKTMTLIVFHKVKSPQSVAPFLPVGTSKTGLQPFVLYTSSYQDSNWETHGRVDLIYLDAFNINDSIDFFSSVLNTGLETEEERNLAEIICSKLGNLPLALKLAGVFIRNEFEGHVGSKTMTVALLRSYLELLDQDSSHMTCPVSDIFETYAFSTWKITIEKLKVQNPMTETIMQVMAYLSPDNIPVGLLHQIKSPSHGNYFDKVQGKIKSFVPYGGRSTCTSAQAAVDLLLSYALISRESETGFRIHPLLQKVIRSDVEGKSKLSTLKDTIDLLKSVLKMTDYSDYEQSCLIHSSFLANHMFSNYIKIRGYPSNLCESISCKQNLSIPLFVDRLEELIAAGKYKDVFESYYKYKEMFDIQLNGMKSNYYAEIFAMKTIIMFCGNMQVLWKNGSSLHSKLLTMCKMCIPVLKDVKMLRIRHSSVMRSFAETADALLVSTNVTEDISIKQYFLKIMLLMYNILFDYSKFFGIDNFTQKYWQYVSACQNEIQLIETVD